MSYFAYGSNWLASEKQRSETTKQRLKVDKKTQQQIEYQIKQLSDERIAVYENDDISDEECSKLSMEISEKINTLIDSMYETKEEVNKRLGYKHYNSI